MNACVALSVAVSLAVLAVSLTDQADGRVKRSAAPPWASSNWSSNRGHNKFTDQDTNGKRGPPGGVPPGLAGNHPPGLSGGGPPGLSGKPGKGQGKPNFEDDDDRPTTDDRPNNGGARPSTDDRINVDEEENNANTRPNQNQGTKCRKNEFRCGSSECLPGSVRCDNKFDCRDSSDEHGCVTKPENEAGCVLPEQPKGGSYELGGCGKPCPKHPGDKVPSNSLLTYTCRDNYILNGSTVSVCVNDVWYNQPSCLSTCPALSSTSVNIVCTYHGEEVSCTERIKPGTVATLSCKSSYNLPVTNDPAYRKLTCLEDGLWDRRLFRCLPECGIPISQGNTLVVNGFEAKLGVFPWHVGIYRKRAENGYEQICGGTLISNNLVVSAAHCFYDEIYNKIQEKSKYAVAAGKHYRDWNAIENYAQKSDAAEISLPERYIGARANFAQDIALIKLANPFELTTLVRPICVDWDNVYERRQLQVGQSGKSVGWGKTIHGVPSENLQEVTMPFVPYDQCLSAVPDDFRGYITSDKFCAGRLNGSSLCEGDSGGGLCFEMQGTWYLRGIVSVSPVKDDKCDYHSYTVFTSTGYFRDWIRAAYVSA
ncbi:PREDICTED: suppressor of tumorigenicity 14 protein-like [Dufourea novaeangliae]|uniref:suppressor of tumorigenicity 14 protein-like n=1 Tax=Dufourea novaeangliae TaxID=178035 RepID=UPI000766FE56|nr:PREDICTED: suppressor of tumorigenicity 14 protein-like [Dufourea novaeangliae]